MTAIAEAKSNQPQLTFFNLPPTLNVSRFQKMACTRKRNTESLKERIKTRFDHLYNVERKRIDDVIECLCKEFSLEKTTIERKLKG